MPKFSKIGSRLEHGIHTISEYIMWVPVVFLFLMMLLTFIDVIGRDIFNRPIQGTQDIVEGIMVLIIFLAAPYAKKSIIRVDVIFLILPERAKALFKIVTTFISAGILTLVVWQLGARALDLLIHPGPTTAILYMPRGPFIMVAAVGCMILCLEFWLEFFHYLVQRMNMKNF